MRHGKKVNHLGRKKGHRKALLSNMATSLIVHKRIKTTVAKAKALRVFVEPILTRAKEDTTHNRRMAFADLGNKLAVKELFDDVSNKIADRPGGYTRIIKMGNRLGDNAEMAMIELVDYNDLYTQSSEKKSRKRRTRRSGAAEPAQKPAQDAAPSEEQPSDQVEESSAAESAEEQE